MALESKFALLFNALIDKINTDVTAIRHIDLDWNQLDYANPPVSFPCLLVDFPQTDFQQMQGYQKGNALVRLKLVYRSFTATSSITPDANREAALEFFELEQDVYEALQAWYAGSLLTDAMIRRNASTEKREDGLRVRIIDFLCAFDDATVAS